ncbi:MAG: winged helix-turn-helix transcriptional regulator [Candidatus Thermoplasmatota archaeon]|nr:winged helix-turn-helix transcriptional regulator [Candidatus Thermoplasmatota archaeon]
MKLLRDKSLSTQLLILLEVARGHYSRLLPIAEKIGITKQAVSDYLKKMKEEGLVQIISGEYKATMEGTQFLHSQLLELKKFLETGIQKLDIIESGVAIAGNNIRKGEKIGLFMENGDLVAYSGRNSPSTGIAMNDAKKEEDVSIKNMDGIVEHKMGKIYLIELPSSDEGGTRAFIIEGLKKAIEKIKPDKIGAADVIAKAALKKIGKKCDFEFASSSATVDAAQRGLDVTFLGCGEEMKKILSEIEEFNSSSVEQLYYEIISFRPKNHKNIKKESRFRKDDTA